MLKEKNKFFYKIISFSMALSILFANIDLPISADITDDYSIWELLVDQQMLDAARKDANVRTAAKLESTRISEVMSDIQEYPVSNGDFLSSFNDENIRVGLETGWKTLADEYRNNTDFIGYDSDGNCIYVLPRESAEEVLELFDKTTITEADLESFDYSRGMNLITKDLLNWKNWDANDPYDSAKIALIEDYISNSNTMGLTSASINNAFISSTGSHNSWYKWTWSGGEISNIYNGMFIYLAKTTNGTGPNLSNSTHYLNEVLPPSGIVVTEGDSYAGYMPFEGAMNSTYTSFKTNIEANSTTKDYYAFLMDYDIAYSSTEISDSYSESNYSSIITTVVDGLMYDMGGDTAAIEYTPTTLNDGTYKLNIKAFQQYPTYSKKVGSYSGHVNTANGIIITNFYPTGYVSGSWARYGMGYVKFDTFGVYNIDRLGLTFETAKNMGKESVFAQVIAKMLDNGASDVFYTSYGGDKSTTLQQLRLDVCANGVIPEVDLAMSYIFVDGDGTTDGWQGVVEMARKYEELLDDMPYPRGFKFHNITYSFTNHRFLNSVSSKNGVMYNADWVFGLNYGIASDNPLTEYQTDLTVREQIVKYIKMEEDEIDEWMENHFLFFCPAYINMGVNSTDCGVAGSSGLAVLKWMTSSIVKNNRLNHYEYWIQNLSNDEDADYYSELVEIPLTDNQNGNLTGNDLKLDSINHWGTYLMIRYKYVDYTYWMYYLLYEPTGQSFCFASPGPNNASVPYYACYEDQCNNNRIVYNNKATTITSTSRSFVGDSNFVWLHANEIVPGTGNYWIDEDTIRQEVAVIEENLSDVDDSGNPVEIVWRGSTEGGSEIWQPDWYWYTPSVPYVGNLRTIDGIRGYGDYYRFKYPVRTEVIYHMVVVPLSAEHYEYSLCLGETAPCKTSPGCADVITLCDCKDETGDIDGCDYDDYDIQVGSILIE